MGKWPILILSPWHYKINWRILMLSPVWNNLFRRIPFKFHLSFAVVVYKPCMKDIILVCMLHNPHNVIFLLLLHHLQGFPARISPSAQCYRNKTSLAPLGNGWGWTKSIQCSANSEFRGECNIKNIISWASRKPRAWWDTHRANSFFCETGTSFGLTPALKYLVVWTSVLLKLSMGRMEKIIFLR